MPTTTASAPLLAICGLGKSYAQVVLADVQVSIARGEVHALVGENGAGKSTLSRIIAGLTQPDRGVLTLRGQPYRPGSKQEGERSGVRMVLQELNLIPTLTVAESICLEHIPHRLGWIDRSRLLARAREALDAFGLRGVDPAQKVGSLGIGQQQLVEIAAGLSQHCDLLILDEPTAALTGPEVDLLFTQIAGLRARGTSVLYISHRLEEIRRIADRVTVLRDGRVVATTATTDVALDQIVRWMVGRDVDAVPKPAVSGVTEDAVALRVAALRAGPAVRGVSFEVRRGEVLGFAGLMGSGRTETMRAVFGADRPESGEVWIGTPLRRLALGSPRAAVEAGLAFLTEDRKAQGLLLPLPVRQNISLSRLRQLAPRAGWIRVGAERAEAEEWKVRLTIRCSSVEQPACELSGGNQQKALLARWLARDAEVLIFDEPTRGVDVGARFEIHQILLELAARGKAVILVSSDLKELLAVSDRIAVMSAGRIAATWARGAWTEDAIMAAALSGYQAGRHA